MRREFNGRKGNSKEEKGIQRKRDKDYRRRGQEGEERQRNMAGED